MGLLYLYILPIKATFVLDTTGLGNTFVDGDGDWNVNGGISLLSTSVCVIHSLPRTWKAFDLELLTDGLFFNCL